MLVMGYLDEATLVHWDQLCVYTASLILYIVQMNNN